MLQCCNNFLPKFLEALYSLQQKPDCWRQVLGHPLSCVELAGKQGNRICHVQTQHFACWQVGIRFTSYKNSYNSTTLMKGPYNIISTAQWISKMWFCLCSQGLKLCLLISRNSTTGFPGNKCILCIMATQYLQVTKTCWYISLHKSFPE